MRRERTFEPGLNYYVPAMQAGADLGQLTEQRVNFGSPAVANANANDVSNAGIDADAGAETTVSIDALEADAPFGRNVAVKASAATGANLVVTVHGRDYLGQAMRETITVGNGDGTTAIAGLKAFKYIDKLVHNGGASNAVTASVGWGAKLGLPYATVSVEREYADGVVASAGTLVAAVRTDPQTATSGDPRGTYVPSTTLNGTKVIEAEFNFTNYVNDDNHGGLHGVAHYAG